MSLLSNYVWAALLAAVLALTGLFAYHERSVQRGKDAAAVAKLTAAAQRHNADLERIAQLTLNNAGAKHDEAVSKPVDNVPDVGLCYYRAAPSVVTVPARGAAGGSIRAPARGGEPAPVRGPDSGDLVPTGSPDAARALLEVGRDADADLALDEAEIGALIAELQKVRAK